MSENGESLLNDRRKAEPPREPSSHWTEQPLTGRLLVALYALIILACLLSYSQTVDNFLLNDDFQWLRAARYEMTPGNLLSYRVVGFFRPLVNLSFFLQEHFLPGRLPLHYQVNLLLHILTALLVLHLFLRILDRWDIAAVAALLFALTSVHAGAVLWMSARTTLLSSVLLMAAMVLLAGSSRRSLTAPLAVLAYVLALAAKETAVIGLPLVLIVYLFLRGGRKEHSFGKPAILAFTVVTAGYFILRRMVIGGFVQEHWGPGWHMLRNVGGGFLYQLHPWYVFRLFWPRGNYIPESEHPFFPEILAVAVLIVLLLAVYRSNRMRVMLLALAWGLAGLLPMSLFRYRFFSTESFTQSRYYYLSSVGTVLVIALLLSMLWRARSKSRTAIAMGLLLLMCTGYTLRNRMLEQKYDRLTERYRKAINALVDLSDNYGGHSVIAVQRPPIAFHYLEAGVRLERPRLRILNVENAGEALAQAPCLHVMYHRVGSFTKMYVKEVE